jgi:hypothetical protein
VDSRNKLNPQLRRMVAAAEASGACVHVYSVREPRRAVPVFKFAINGFPRKPLGDCYDTLAAMAARPAIR